jgi:predicted Zn-dependent protease
MAFLEKRGGMLEAERESMIGDEYFYLTETFHALDEKKSLKDFALKCADHFSQMQKNSSLKISRVGYQGMVACLELAGDYAREDKALKVLLATYPNEPTFMWRKARMLRAQKKLDEALVWIQKAETLAYGYNWFSIQLLKAQILLSQKKNAQAEKVIHAALAQVELDSSTESRNQRLVARLRGLEASAREHKQN